MITTTLLTLLLSTPGSALEVPPSCRAALSSIRRSVEWVADRVPRRPRLKLVGEIQAGALPKLEPLIGKTMRVRVVHDVRDFEPPTWRDGLRWRTYKYDERFRGRFLGAIEREDAAGLYDLRFEVAGQIKSVRGFLTVTTGGFFGRSFDRRFSSISLYY